jgi:hypothetical protein
VTEGGGQGIAIPRRALHIEFFLRHGTARTGQPARPPPCWRASQSGPRPRGRRRAGRRPPGAGRTRRAALVVVVVGCVDVEGTTRKATITRAGPPPVSSRPVADAWQPCAACGGLGVGGWGDPRRGGLFASHLLCLSTVCARPVPKRRLRPRCARLAPAPLFSLCFCFSPLPSLPPFSFPHTNPNVRPVRVRVRCGHPRRRRLAQGARKEGNARAGRAEGPNEKNQAHTTRGLGGARASVARALAPPLAPLKDKALRVHAAAPFS